MTARMKAWAPRCLGGHSRPPGTSALFGSCQGLSSRHSLPQVEAWGGGGGRAIKSKMPRDPGKPGSHCLSEEWAPSMSGSRLCMAQARAVLEQSCRWAWILRKVGP